METFATISRVEVDFIDKIWNATQMGHGYQKLLQQDQDGVAR